MEESLSTTTDTRPDVAPDPATNVDPDADFDLDIRIFESGIGLDEVIRMTDDGCGATCESACTSCDE